MKIIRPALIILIGLISVFHSYAFNIGIGHELKKNVQKPNLNIYEGNVLLTTQQQVDAFGNQAYDGINGDLHISGSDIISLAALSTIAYAANIEINANTALLDIDGFDSLQSATTLHIHHNGLTGIGGFHALRSIPFITISNNNNLESIGGFDVLVTIIGSLRIENNPLLSQISGLNVLSDIGQDFIISHTALDFGVDAFPALNLINGNLNISYCTGNRMNGFNGILNLHDVSMTQNSFTEINGLNQLEIGNNITISFNPLLVTIDGFSNMTEVYARLSLSTNPLLTEIAGFNNVTAMQDLQLYNNSINFEDNYFYSLASIEGYLSIAYNNNTSNLDSFNNLDHVTGYVSISNCNSENINGFHHLLFVNNLLLTGNGFEHVSGFNALSLIKGSLSITYTANLEDITGFNNLTTILVNIDVTANAILFNLDGFQNLTFVNGLHISQNAMLTTLAGLGNLELIGATAYVRDNPLLSFCAIYAVCNRITGGGADIGLNVAGCNLESEVSAMCNLSVSDHQISDGIFAPNPTDGIIYFAIDSKQVALYNNLGQLVSNIAAKNNQIDISGFSAGLYYLKYQNENGIFLSKVIKK